MSNGISMMFAIIFAVTVLFFVPSYQMAQKQDDLAQQVVYTETHKFVDSVRSKGYVTKEMLEEFQKSIEIGSYVYRVELEHEKKIYTPVFTDPQDASTFTGAYEVQYDNFYTKQINDHLYTQNQEKYKMSEEDFFSVKVQNLNRTMATVILDAFQGVSVGDNSRIFVPYGGMVLNENY